MRAERIAGPDHLLGIRHMVRCVRDLERPVLSADHAAHVLDVIDAARRSTAEGRIVGVPDFTKSVSGLQSIAGAVNPGMLPLNIQVFETELATVNNLPGIDFAVKGAAGFTNPEFDVGLEVSGITTPEA